MRHLKHIAVRRFDARCVFPGQEAKPDKALGLVKGKKVFHPVTETFRHELRIFPEPFYGLRIHPAAPLVDLIRQFPVIQRDIGLDPRLQQSVYQITVKGDSRLVYPAFPLGEHSGPVDGKAVRLYPHLLHHRNIFPVPLIMVTRGIPRVTAEYPPFLLREHIPYVHPLTVLTGRAFDLICTGGSALILYRLLTNTLLFCVFPFLCQRSRAHSDRFRAFSSASIWV